MAKALAAKTLTREEAERVFDRFKEAVGQIAVMPKAALLNGEPNRRKRAQKPKTDK